MFLGFDFKELFQNFFEKAESSFKKSINGEEDIKILIRYWAIPSYIFFYFFIKLFIDKVDLAVINIFFASFAIAFYIWHLYAIYKCKPKKKKLTKEEREALKRDRSRTLSKSFTRKLFLQESISKWDPVTVTIVADIFFLITFLAYF